MAKTKDSRERCSAYAHKWNSGVCTVCVEEHPAARRQRIWNDMMRRIVEAGADAYGKVPPAPDYSTPEAVTQRCLEGGTRNRWYLEFVRITRQQGRAYREFRRAAERTGATLTLPFPIATTPRAREAA